MSSPTSTSSSSAKVELWKRHVASSSALSRFSVTNCFDLTTSPARKRASFPYSILPPLRHITYDELIHDFLRLPSVGWTALGSFIAGVLLTLSARWSLLSSSSSSSSSPSSLASASRPLRLIITLLGALLAVRWVSTRFPKRQLISESLNVSSHSGGPCVVTGPVLTLTNSHAGTHADTPSHFLHHNHAAQCSGGGDASTASQTSSPPKFDKVCYSGDCVVLDLTTTLAERNTSEIDDAVLQDAMSRASSLFSSSSTTSNCWEDIFRLIIRTTSINYNNNNGNNNDAASNNNDQWRDDFAYFSVAGATFLTQKCSKLLMIGTDSPSVDRVDASPLIQNAHGVFWKHRVAIVENIDCSPLVSIFAGDGGGAVAVDDDSASSLSGRRGLIRGQVQCVFNDAQKFEDAEGCNVLFYPDEQKI